MLNTTDKIIKHKTGLLNLAEELGNVSKACQVMGMSRDTFYRYKSAVEDGGVEALFERTRRKPNLANRVDQATEQAVIKSATDFPAYGQAKPRQALGIDDDLQFAFCAAKYVDSRDAFNALNAVLDDVLKEIAVGRHWARVTLLCGHQDPRDGTVIRTGSVQVGSLASSGYPLTRSSRLDTSKKTWPMSVPTANSRVT